MISELTRMSTKPKSTREIIISVLIKEYPLSAKEVYNRVLKVSSKDTTYQAVHKAIQELSAEGSITKQGKDYQLNPNWITNLKSFVKDAEESYTKNQAVPEKPGKNANALLVEVLLFNSRP